MLVLKSDVLAEVETAEAKICQNCGIPNATGTERWSDIREQAGYYYIIAPGPQGWGGFTHTQMMEGVLLCPEEIEVIHEQD